VTDMMIADVAGGDTPRPSVAGGDTPRPRYRYRRQHVVQSLLVNSDSDADTESDSDVSDVDSRSSR